MDEGSHLENKIGNDKIVREFLTTLFCFVFTNFKTTLYHSECCNKTVILEFGAVLGIFLMVKINSLGKPEFLPVFKLHKQSEEASFHVANQQFYLECLAKKLVSQCRRQTVSKTSAPR